jgi:hypothetical protein
VPLDDYTNKEVKTKTSTTLSQIPIFYDRILNLYPDRNGKYTSIYELVVNEIEIPSEKSETTHGAPRAP